MVLINLMIKHFYFQWTKKKYLNKNNIIINNCLTNNNLIIIKENLLANLLIYLYQIYAIKINYLIVYLRDLKFHQFKNLLDQKNFLRLMKLKFLML